MKNDKYSWFKIMHAEGFGQKSLHYIYSQLKVHGLSISDVFQRSEKDLKELFPNLGKGKFSRATFQNLYKLDDTLLSNAYEALCESDVSIITVDDEMYPKRIFQVLGSDTPLVLFCKGMIALFNSPSVSIVGSRNANEQTIKITKVIASEYSNRGYNIISGNAKGTDRAAHSAALEANGTTTLVLPEGFNNSIYTSIENRTLVVSQFLPHTIFRGSFAMIRNKLLVALSQETIVVASGPERDETGKMSGTFDAARSALQMNIPLSVVSPEMFETSPAGNRDIIYLGAKTISKNDRLFSLVENVSTQPQTSWIKT